MRLRNSAVEGRVAQGGVVNPASLTPGFAEGLNASGRRPGHYQAFLNLLRRAYLWDKARERYRDINVPVLVIYGDHDWSHLDERQRPFPGRKGPAGRDVVGRKEFHKSLVR